MNSLSFLEETHPELFKLLSKAKEFSANNELAMSACQLRIYGEKFLPIFCAYHNINIPNEITTQFEKLDFLKREYPAIFTSNICSKIHKIRMVDNNGAHGDTVTKSSLMDALRAADYLPEELTKAHSLAKNTESNDADASPLIGLMMLATIVGGVTWLIKKALR